MHILKIIHGFPPQYNAGSEVYSYSIVEELSKNQKVTVFTREENVFEPDFKFRYEKRQKYDVFYANMPRSKDAYNHQIFNENFDELLQKLKPNIVHIGHLNHLSTGIINVIKKYNIPIIFTLHDYWLICPRGQFLQRNFDGKNLHQLCDFQEDNKCANSCYKMYFSNEKSEEYYTYWVKKRQQDMKDLVKKVDFFIAPSKFLMQKYINYFNLPESKIKYVDYGFPLHYLRPVTNKKNDLYTFGYIGRIIPAKGVDLLLKAFKAIKKPAKLKIWGIDDGQTLKALKQMSINCKNPIEFCGEYVNKNLADTVFSNVDTIVVPSIWAENSPLVIHEAQACRIPVITGNYGGMAEYVKHHINGLLFDFRNSKSLTEQMLWAIEHPKQMQILGQQGYLYSDDKNPIRIKEHVAELMKIYKKFIKSKLKLFDAAK
jgi:glycosyltransferase involved in cell wall biosynthesis